MIAYLDDICFPGEPIESGILEWSEWWVAMSGKEPVAYAGLKSQDGGAKAFLCRAGVLPQARGGRLQKRLIRVREAYARAHLIPRVYTYVSAWGLRSMNSLLSCGYRPYYTARMDTVDGGQNTFIYLQKHLTPVTMIG